jgi:hypothetical protein
MSIENFSNEKTIKIETIHTEAKANEDLLGFLPKAPINQKRFFKFFVIIPILIIILLSVIKVPFCGSYIDAYVFEFVFGNAKFLVYLFFILFCIFHFLNSKKLKIFVSKHFIIG